MTLLQSIQRQPNGATLWLVEWPRTDPAIAMQAMPTKGDVIEVPGLGDMVVVDAMYKARGQLTTGSILHDLLRRFRRRSVVGLILRPTNGLPMVERTADDDIIVVMKRGKPIYRNWRTGEEWEAKET